MTVTTITRTFLAVAIAAGALASSALGAGEPKNQAPFTRSVGQTAAPSVAAAIGHVSGKSALGEPKNQAPFTRIAGTGTRIAILATVKHSSGTLVQVGEPKNEAPFTSR